MDINSFPIKLLMKYAIIPLLMIAGVAFYKYFYWLPQDNPIEEKAEDVFFQFTGINFDLSPDTPEIHKKESNATK